MTAFILQNALRIQTSSDFGHQKHKFLKDPWTKMAKRQKTK